MNNFTVKKTVCLLSLACILMQMKELSLCRFLDKITFHVADIIIMPQLPKFLVDTPASTRERILVRLFKALVFVYLIHTQRVMSLHLEDDVESTPEGTSPICTTGKVSPISHLRSSFASDRITPYLLKVGQLIENWLAWRPPCIPL